MNLVSDFIKTFYIQKDENKRTTMVSYLLNKITKCKQDMQRNQNNILESCAKGEFKDLTKWSEKLNELHDELRNLNREFAEHCTVADIVECEEYLNMNDLAHVFRYSKKISIADRDILIKLNYGFREAQVA